MTRFSPSSTSMPRTRATPQRPPISRAVPVTPSGRCMAFPSVSRTSWTSRDGVTTGGSKAWRDRVSETTGTMAQRLIAAGMIVIGKTHTVEFAFGAWGTNQHMGDAAQSLGHAHPSHARRLEQRLRRRRVVAHGAVGDRHRHRRLGSHSLRDVRADRSEDHGRADTDRRHPAAQHDARHGRAAGAQRRRRSAPVRRDANRRPSSCRRKRFGAAQRACASRGCPTPSATASRRLCSRPMMNPFARSRAWARRSLTSRCRTGLSSSPR